MRTVIAGGHGKIALRLARLLAARGDTTVGLIRDPEQAEDVRTAGGEPVVLDLEETTATRLAEALSGADAVVFAAGAGPGSGAARKHTVDRDAAGLLADSASLAGVRRYLMVSSMRAGTEPPPGTDPVFAVYLRAKGEADDDLRGRSAELDWTILRPGGLTDAPGTGLVHLAPAAEPGTVPRDDVAATLAALLGEPGSIGLTLDLVSGETPIPEAVQEAAS